jgi:hypothetical protein
MNPPPCPNHLIHQHTFPELALSTASTGSNQQPYFRAMIFFNKKPGLSDAFFHEHWKSVHADLTMQVGEMGKKRGGVVRYVQFHQTRQHVKALEPLLEASGGTMKMLKWDGAAEFWAETAEDFVGFMMGVYGAKELVGESSLFRFGESLDIVFWVFLHLERGLWSMGTDKACVGCGSRFVDLVKGYEIMGGYDNLILGQGVPVYGRDGISELDSRLKKNARNDESEAQLNEKADSAIDVGMSAAED